MLFNFLKLFFSNAFSSALSILLLPLFTRIYDPSSFGEGELIILISSFLSLAFTMRLEHGIIINKEALESEIIEGIFFNFFVLFFFAD